MAGKWEYVYRLDGGEVPTVISLPVAASQTLVKGDVVVLSSKQIVKAGDGTGRVVGVMMQDSASAAANTLVKVAVVHPAQVWRGTASADATSHVLNGRTYDLSATTQTLNVADTTGGCAQILVLGDKGNTDVYVQFTVCELA